MFVLVNGKTHIIPVAEKEAAELLEWLDFLRTRSGKFCYHLSKILLVASLNYSKCLKTKEKLRFL